MARPTGKVRLAIDFPNPEALLNFVDVLKHGNPDLFDGVDAFAMDDLDDRGDKGGVTTGNTFVLKRARDRVAGSSLRERLEA